MIERVLARYGGVAARLVGSEGDTVEVPAELVGVLMAIVRHLQAGHGVTVASLQAELTRVEAAELLNVSRPHLIKLVDGGALPFRMVGTRRRLRLVDVLAYRDRQDAAAREVVGDVQLGQVEGRHLAIDLEQFLGDGLLVERASEHAVQVPAPREFDLSGMTTEVTHRLVVERGFGQQRYGEQSLIERRKTAQLRDRRPRFSPLPLIQPLDRDTRPLGCFFPRRADALSRLFQDGGRDGCELGYRGGAAGNNGENLNTAQIGVTDSTAAR